MNYLVILIVLFTSGLTYSQKDTDTKSVASIVMTRGRDVYVYSASKKISLEGKKMPFQLYPGDEVQLGLDSDAELVFSNKDTMYAGAESLFSLDWYKGSMNYIWIKYGSLLYRGENPAAVKASDLSVISKNGDFFIRYKRSLSEAVILNFGSDVMVKQGDDEEPYILKNNFYVKSTSFRNDKKMHGTIDPSKLQNIYDTFRIIYAPNEKDSGADILKNNESEKASNLPPVLKKANIDFMKRTIGI